MLISCSTVKWNGQKAAQKHWFTEKYAQIFYAKFEKKKIIFPEYES